MVDRAHTDEPGDPYEDVPRAPSSEAWDRMTPEERRRAVDALPSEFDRQLFLPEGDPHFNTKMRVRATLDDFFARMGRPVYLACELPVYYPGERMFAPDLMAVVDVSTHERMRWVVSDERRGLDLALEIRVSGDRHKDYEANVERYARLGIREYFVFDRTRLHLAGWRLGEGRRYHPIVPQFGRFHSEVLGLDMRREDHRLRFYVGTASVPTSAELVGTLEGMLEGLEERLHRKEAEAEAQVKAAEARAEAEAAARAEEAAARAEAEAKLAEALAEIERLRRRL
jgi:hypothetical protein